MKKKSRSELIVILLILLGIPTGIALLWYYDSNNNNTVVATETPDVKAQQIQDLQSEVDQLKKQPPKVVVKEVPRDIAPGDKSDYSTIVAEWQNRVAKVICDWNDADGSTEIQLEGSSTLVNRTGYGLIAVTNKHVIDQNGVPPNKCVIGVYGNGGRSVGYSENSNEGPYWWGDDRDWGYIELDNPLLATDNGAFDTAARPKLKTCTGQVNLGDKVVVLGYPAIGTQSGITVTDGIISGIETDYYVTSAKIDHGNSGGAAILLKDDCYLGIPTWVKNLGGFESLGRILKWNFVIGS